MGGRRWGRIDGGGEERERERKRRIDGRCQGEAGGVGARFCSVEVSGPAGSTALPE